MSVTHLRSAGNTGAPEPPRYADVAHLYYEAGWRGILPLPYRRKGSPPTGWTGKTAPFPTLDRIDQWRRTRGRGGAGIRLDKVLGVDVDAYDGKLGGLSFQRLIEECGELPATWITTSRTDGSGIRLFRVPPDIDWTEAAAGSGVELIRKTHRYCVVWPSVHPEGRMYRWIAPDGTDPAGIPRVDELPELPAAWVHRLTRRDVPEQRRPVVNFPDASKARNFAERTLLRVIDDLATMRPGMGRNNALNRRSYYLGGLVGAGLLDETTAFEALVDAAAVNGHTSKHGAAQTERTIRSGLNAGMRHPLTGGAA